MNYNLNQSVLQSGQKASNIASLRKLMSLIGEERLNLIKAFIAIFINAGLSLSRSIYYRPHDRQIYSDKGI